MFKTKLDPNDIDDVEIELPANDIDFINLKSGLQDNFSILSEQSFHSYIKKSNFTIVFFYLPCKYILNTFL